MHPIFNRFVEMNVPNKIIFFVSAFCVILSIPLLIVSILFNDSAFAHKVQSLFPSNGVEEFFLLLRNLGIAGACCTFFFHMLGILAALSSNQGAIGANICACILCKIGVAVCAVLPLVTAAFISTACAAISADKCYQCPTGTSYDDCSTQSSKSCWYYQGEKDDYYNSMCHDFVNKMWFVVAGFFTVSGLSFMNCICSCVSLCMGRKNNYGGATEVSMHQMSRT